MSFSCNNPLLKKRRRSLRKNQTDAERSLWQHLRNHRLEGLKFYRQYSVGPFILDFYCPALRFAIELDGGHHNERAQKISDTRRTAYLGQFGISVVRFWDDEVLKNIEGVVEKIMTVLKRMQGNPLSSPLR